MSCVFLLMYTWFVIARARYHAALTTRALWSNATIAIKLKVPLLQLLAKAVIRVAVLAALEGFRMKSLALSLGEPISRAVAPTRLRYGGLWHSLPVVWRYVFVL